ncbi:protease modulator HflK [Paramixta manurensis]|uniref:Protease modulator HflK n=1 Tax=Paramixta manurensis TaxID=2740817 RepID=A0A6M8U9R6_9GAMM|nr:protease modulator HflK [Erwiniaceae bacterium PD-1]
MRLTKASGVDVIGQSPRFQLASTHIRWLSWLFNGIVIASMTLLPIALLLYWLAPESLWLPLTGNLTATLWVFAVSLQGARRVARWRQRAFEPLTEDASVAAAPPAFFQRLTPPLWLRQTVSYLGSHVLYQALPALAALYLIGMVWALPLPANDNGKGGYLIGAILVFFAFGFLVLERHWALKKNDEWPEAIKLAPLARMVILVLLLDALSLMFARGAAVWPAHLLILGGIVPGLVALELLLRALIAVFSPPRADEEPAFIAASLLASQLSWPPRPFQFMHNELHQRFGIDLRQIWAFHFMRRAILPLAAFLLLVGWLLTGLNQVPLTQRGIYEYFGKPVAVRQPGLHIGLPWPFGRVQAVENGEVHELTTGAEEPVSTAAAAAPIATAEGAAPVSANRLWDVSHIGDKSQIIASASGDRQSFQIMNMDVRFVYRIGLSDKAALAAHYHTENVPLLIRSIANQVLVHDFATRTLDSLLGEEQSQLAANIGREVQNRLNQLDSGVELLATVIESIHPPAGAADAYHAVQAAQIQAQTAIAGEKGQAAVQLNAAQQFASQAFDEAHAQSSENHDRAQVTALRFNAENQAFQVGGQSFLTERYFSQLTLAAHQHAGMLIIDHRLGGETPPVLDLRSLTLPFTPGAESTARSVKTEKTR